MLYLCPTRCFVPQRDQNFDTAQTRVTPHFVLVNKMTAARYGSGSELLEDEMDVRSPDSRDDLNLDDVEEAAPPEQENGSNTNGRRKKQ